MKVGRWLLPSLVCALVAPTAAVADVPTLPRTTTIAGSQAGYIEVELDRPVYLDKHVPTASFDGGGLFSAAVLRSDFPGGPPGRHSFDAWRMPGIQGLGWKGSMLPAGPYRLYLIAVEPGSVTLSFDDLSAGGLSLTSVIETPFEAGEIETRGTGTLVRYGENRYLHGGGWGHMRAIVEDPPPGTRIETCWYPYGTQADAGEHAYEPGCPAGISGWEGELTAPGSGAFSLALDHDEMDLGLGGNVTVPAGSPGPIDVWRMWAAYDSPPPSDLPPEEAVPSVTGTESLPPVSGPAWSAPSLRSKRLLMRGRMLRVPLACPSTGPCRGSVAVSNGARKRYLITDGREIIRVSVPRSIARRVLRRGHARATVRIRSKLADEVRVSRVAVRVVPARRGAR